MKNVKLNVSKRTLNKVMKEFLIAIDKSVGGTGKEVFLNQGAFFASIQYDFEEAVNVRDFLYNIEFLMNDGSNYNGGLGYICANMGKRAPYTKGFAQITRVLLHEFGHQMTYDKIIALYGKEEIERMYKIASGNNARYIYVPTEFVATKWAIDWLADPEHRKIAREFERKFWACFK